MCDNFLVEETLTWQRMVKKGTCLLDQRFPFMTLAMHMVLMAYRLGPYRETSVEAKINPRQLSEMTCFFFFPSFLLPGPSTWQKQLLCFSPRS